MAGFTLVCDRQGGDSGSHMTPKTPWAASGLLCQSDRGVWPFWVSKVEHVGTWSLSLSGASPHDSREGSRLCLTTCEP